MAVKKNEKEKGKSFPGAWIFRNLLTAVLIVAVLVVGSMILLNVLTQHNRELSVPDFSNMSLAEAEVSAQQAGVRIDVTDSVFVRKMRKGAVYRQNPAPGAKVKNGRRIMLTINAVNAKKVTMPDLVGYSMRQAKAELLSRGLVLGRLIYVQDIATNNVLRQLYDNHEIAPGVLVESESVIDLVVGLNSSDNVTYVPDVTGLKNLSARDAVQGNSLNIRTMKFDDTVKDYDDSLNAVVYRQEPSHLDSLPKRMGDSMVLYLTLDHTKVPVKEMTDEK
jgi:beta-lactam-binding protein with PASTA domain